MNINPVCAGVGCPLRKHCKRYKTQIDYLTEPYFSPSPYDKKNKTCSKYVGPDKSGIMKLHEGRN